MRLNERQREALRVLAGERHRLRDPGSWYGVEQGVDGRTGKALVRRGLAEERREKFETPVRRFTMGYAEYDRYNTYPVFRITDAGREALDQIEEGEGP